MSINNARMRFSKKSITWSALPDNHPGFRCMAPHSGVHGLLVVHAIPDEASDDAANLAQQRRHLRRVLLRACRERGCDNLTLGIHPNVQFLPAFGLLLTVLLGMLCALATDLQAMAVNDQGYRSFRGTIDLLSDRHGGMAA